ncbi:MAG: DUF2871 domain-containing protein [Oscillospiraceae bacterium]
MGVIIVSLKLIKTSFFYLIAGLVGGVFYREFTKFNGFSGQRTVLANVHLHLLMLGMLFFLVAALLEKQFGLSQEKKFQWFYRLYNPGLVITAGTFIWRGVLRVRGAELSRALDASISGIAGVGHALLGLGLIFFFLALLKRAR